MPQRGVQGFEFQPGEAQPRFHGQLLGHHHLVQRCVAEAAGQLQAVHQLLERQVLVQQAAAQTLGHLLHQGGEVGLGLEVRPDRQVVQQNAEQAFGARLLAMGDRGADQHGGIAAQAVHQHGETGEQHRERRGAEATGEGLHSATEVGTEFALDDPGAVALHRRPWMVGGQRQQRAAFAVAAVQGGGPVIQLALEFGALQVFALPEGEVGVLHRQGRQFGGGAVATGFIPQGQFPQRDGGRPGVRHQVMQGDAQHVLSRCQAQQAGTQQRRGGQVERLLEGVLQGVELCAFAGGGGQAGQILEGQGDVQRLADALARHAVGAVDAGAQDFMARQQVIQAGVQCLDIEFTLEVQGERDVEQRRARGQLLDEPQTLLRERQRQQGRARLGFRCLEGDGLWRGGVGLAGGDAHGQQGHGGLFEQRAQRQVEFEMAAQSRNDLGRQQRMAAEGEEVVFHAHGVAPQDLGPDRRHGGFQGVARGNALLGVGLPVQFPGGQGLAIDLAVVVQRQAVQADEGGRDHVRRQLRPQVLAQPVAAQGVVMGRPVRHQPGFTHAVFPQQDGGFAHVRVLRETVFDFGQFDPVAAQFYLLVAAAEVFDHPVCAPASQVAGAIHTTFKLRVLDERFGGALRIVQVATADADATDTDFPCDTHGHWTQGFVQHIQAVVGGRLADGHVADVRGRGFEDRLEGHVVGAFGRPVGIHQGDVGEAREPVPGHGRRQGFTGGQHPAQVRQLQVAWAQGEQGAHQARDYFQHAQAFAGEHLQQALRVVGDFVREDVHGGAEHRRGEELPHGNVERHRSGLRDPVLGAEPQGRDLAEDVIEHAPLFDHHALRRTGRTRGEEHVGEAVRAAESRQRRVVASPPASFGEQRHGGLFQTAEQRIEQGAATFTGDQQRRAGQAEDLPQALGRVIDFQGQHRRAGLEHGNHHGQQRQATGGG
ncbi:hypothetical protein BN844_2187 [Pseudomonas sp. SHC52]|nr:hypothetical protein BN844_2187 [Pseudomonas sp. SHC52]